MLPRSGRDIRTRWSDSSGDRGGGSRSSAGAASRSVAYTLTNGLDLAPLADGVVNHQISDHNDYANLQDAKDCALFACCHAPSSCPTWIQ